MSQTTIPRNLASETYEVARMYERRVNPNFWDLVRSGKRRKEFKQAFGRMAVGMKAEINREVLNMSAEERKVTVTSRIIEQKQAIERINAEEMTRERPQRGKIANWFNDKSGFVKGALTGATAFLLSGTAALTAGGFMLNKLGRTNTDANPDILQQAQARANGNLQADLERVGSDINESTNVLHDVLDKQAEDVRDPLVADAKAMAIGGALGVLAINTFVNVMEASAAAETSTLHVQL